MKSIESPAPFQLEDLAEPTLPTWASKALRTKHAEIKAAVAVALKSRAEFVQRFEALNNADPLAADFPTPDQRARARVQQLRDELAARDAIQTYHDDLEADAQKEHGRRNDAILAAQHEAIAKLTAAGFVDFDLTTRPRCIDDHVVGQYGGFRNAYQHQQDLTNERSRLYSESGVNSRAHAAIRQRLEQLRQNALRDAALV